MFYVNAISLVCRLLSFLKDIFALGQKYTARQDDRCVDDSSTMKEKSRFVLDDPRHDLKKEAKNPAA